MPRPGYTVQAWGSGVQRAAASNCLGRWEAFSSPEQNVIHSILSFPTSKECPSFPSAVLSVLVTVWTQSGRDLSPEGTHGPLY